MQLPSGPTTEIEAAKQASIGQLLMKAARLFNEEAIGRVRKRTGLNLSTAHTSLLPHIAWEGTRPTELSQKTGASKQLVGQWIQDLEAIGVLCRVRDPKDGRAWKVRFTQQGMEAMKHGLGVLKELEGEVEKDLGAERMRSFHQTLLLLVQQLEKIPSEGG